MERPGGIVHLPADTVAPLDPACEHDWESVVLALHKTDFTADGGLEVRPECATTLAACRCAACGGLAGKGWR
jgi:hypothetical protein